MQLLTRARRALLAFAATLLALAAFTAPAQAKWLKAETDHFVIHSDTGERELREYAVDLETFDALLRLRHGRKPGEATARKLPIYLVRDLKELRRAQPEAQEGQAGVYLSGEQDVYALAIRKFGDDVLLHEYVHHFMLGNFPNAYPTWLVEGYAEYFASAEFKPQEVNFGKPSSNRAGWLNNGKWLKVADLLRLHPQQLKSGEQRSMYYGQAWLLTHYMLSDPRRLDQLQAYARDVSAGRDPVAAMEKATGASLTALDNALRSYFGGGIKYGRLPRNLLPAPAVTISELPASAGDLLLEAQLLKRGVPQAMRAEVLAKVRARAAKHPGDRLADVTLARAETTIGDRAAGEAILTRRLAADGADAEALRLLAQSRLAAAAEEKDATRAAAIRTEARRYAARAMNVDQSDYQTLMTFVQTRSGLPGYPTADDLKALLLAHGMAPQVAALRVNTAMALVLAKQEREALRLLQPVANNPHGGPAAEAAQTAIRLIAEGPQMKNAAPPTPAAAAAPR